MFRFGQFYNVSYSLLIACFARKLYWLSCTREKNSVNRRQDLEAIPLSVTSSQCLLFYIKVVNFIYYDFYISFYFTSICCYFLISISISTSISTFPLLYVTIADCMQTDDVQFRFDRMFSRGVRKSFESCTGRTFFFIRKQVLAFRTMR